ncbi:alpha-1,2-fucosyltransferase [Opitutales bacterium]|nr:alpha-1,2-fucosyltransferase [Opitutales bacterium]
MAKKIIIRQEYGQLGNILFRLANALGFAIEHGYRVEDYTLAFCNYHDGSSNIRFFEDYHPFQFFEFPRPKVRLSNRIKWRLKDRLNKRIECIENFDPTFNLQKLDTNKSYELKGFHFGSGELAFKHRSQICDILRFKESEILPIENLINEAKKRYDLLLGVHIRQNDYKSFYDGKFYVTPEQYLQTVDHFKSLHLPSQRIGVVVCSDDGEALKKIQDNHQDYLFPNGTIAQDMYALSKCDYIIGPKATTMSSWASFIGESMLLQIDKSIDPFELTDFQSVQRLEPFSPFFN